MDVSIILPRLTDGGRYGCHARALFQAIQGISGQIEIVLLDGHASSDDFAMLALELGPAGESLKLWPLPANVSWATAIATAADICTAPHLLFLPAADDRILAAGSLLARLARFDAVFLKHARSPLARHWQRLSRWTNPAFLLTGLHDPDWSCFAVKRESLKAIDFAGLRPAWLSQRLQSAGYRVGEATWKELALADKQAHVPEPVDAVGGVFSANQKGASGSRQAKHQLNRASEYPQRKAG